MIPKVEEGRRQEAEGRRQRAEGVPHKFALRIANLWGPRRRQRAGGE
ncbi:hypothetical protein [Fischerella sp. FACHB-380]|nr:hypothetical protein [Fischerella sp. FACHB-380]